MAVEVGGLVTLNSFPAKLRMDGESLTSLSRIQLQQMGGEFSAYNPPWYFPYELFEDGSVVLHRKTLDGAEVPGCLPRGKG